MRERERRGPGAAVLIGVIAVLVLLAAVWFGKGLFMDSPAATSNGPSAAITSPSDSQTSSGTPTTEVTSSETPPTTTVDPVVAQVDACKAGWQLQAAATSAAATVLGEWKAHIDIMNNLQAGRVTLAEAKKGWGPTTAQASPHIAAFHAADQAYQSATTQRCTPPTDPASPNPDAKSLATCAASMKVVDGILAKARTAIAPWETHLKDQSHFKSGGMTAAKAEALWRSLWQQGLRLNPPYFDAVAAGKNATCPLAS